MGGISIFRMHTIYLLLYNLLKLLPGFLFRVLMNFSEGADSFSRTAGVSQVYMVHSHHPVNHNDASQSRASLSSCLGTGRPTVSLGCLESCRMTKQAIKLVGVERVQLLCHKRQIVKRIVHGLK